MSAFEWWWNYSGRAPRGVTKKETALAAWNECQGRRRAAIGNIPDGLIIEVTNSDCRIIHRSSGEAVDNRYTPSFMKACAKARKIGKLANWEAAWDNLRLTLGLVEVVGVIMDEYEYGA